MFNRVFGDSDLRTALEGYAESLEQGEMPSLSEMKQCLVSATKTECSHVLLGCLGETTGPLGIMASFMVHYMECDQQTCDTANDYLLRTIKNDSELEVLAFILLSSLDELPDDFREAVDRGLTSEHMVRQITAAACGVKFSREFDPLASRSVRVLEHGLKNDDRAVRLLATVGLAKCRLQTPENSERLRQFLVDASFGEQLHVISNLKSTFKQRNGLVNYLIDLAADAFAPIDVRAATYRMLGHICPTILEIQRLFVERLDSEHDWETVLGLGLGLTNQHLEFPVECFPTLFVHLQSEDPNMRLAAACVCLEAADTLSTTELETIAGQIEDEANDVIREKLLRCFSAAGPAAVSVAMRLVKSGPNLLRTCWISILSQLCGRHPEVFFSAYREHGDERVDEVMPIILSGATIFSSEIIRSIRSALSSTAALERSNGLLALKNADADAAAATPELVDLCLYGSTEEQERAEPILFRFGVATNPYLRDYDRVTGPEALQKFQRIQRLLSVPEADIRDVELAGVGDNDCIRTFVAAAEVLDAAGPTSFPKLQDVLQEQCADGQLPENLSVSATRIRKSIDMLENRLSAFAANTDRVVLLSRKPNQPGGLTDIGRSWLDRCRKYLRVIDGVMQE